MNMDYTSQSQTKSITKEAGKEYIKYIKSKSCLVCANQLVDADHLLTIGMGGNRRKPTWKDYTCIPLCREHHTERHVNWKKFEEKYRINTWQEAFKLLLEYVV